MTEQLFKGYKGNYLIATQLGKGGEGQVYDLQNKNDLVLKLYNEELDVEKERKLKFMASMNSTNLQSFAAWPTDAITDKTGKVIGFVMKKFTGYVPLHMLFSPMDRKKIFPDKGYDFLVHVARNLAIAFHKLHQAGIIVGDVNEGNVLVNSSGMVGFIDCDSFQIKEGNKYYFCEVGVPRYTAPELLIKMSFEQVVRTVNTDSFSMAILIFQLLFLGRHPFAGRNNSNLDIDEETAIKGYQFAYSLKNETKKLLPPIDSIEIQTLSEGLIQLFHEAFEKKDNRPFDEKWITQLELFGKDLKACSVSKIHSYPKKLDECPWCRFSRIRGIVYFIDDSYFKINPIANIDNFVNGFKIEPLSSLKKQLVINRNDLIADPIDSKYVHLKSYRQIGFAFTVIAFAALCFINLWFIALGIIVLASFDNIFPFQRQLKNELKKREGEFTTLKSQLELTIKEYNNSIELANYNKAINQFTSLLSSFKGLPAELLDKKRTIEEALYNEQLYRFLRQFDIRDYTIPSFRATKKLTLYSNSIQTAADIDKLNSIKIFGFGPQSIQILFSWQRQIISRFAYKPDTSRLTVEINRASSEISAKRIQLESVIRRDFQSIQYLKNSVLTKQTSLENRINVLAPTVRKAELNCAEFKKLVA